MGVAFGTRPSRRGCATVGWRRRAPRWRPWPRRVRPGRGCSSTRAPWKLRRPRRHHAHRVGGGGRRLPRGGVLHWQAEAQKAAEKGAREVRLRIGVVLGEAGRPGEDALALPNGLGGPMGDGRQHLAVGSHRRRGGGGAVCVIGRPCAAANVTAPQPLRWRDFAAAFGRALHRPAVIPVPGFASASAFGEGATAVLSGENRCAAGPARRGLHVLFRRR